MQTILTDGERDLLMYSWSPNWNTLKELVQKTEDAVLVKVREQEPVVFALRFPDDPRLCLSVVFDTEKEAKDYAEALSSKTEIVALVPYAAPLPAVVQATDVNDWFLSLPDGRQKVLREDKWLLAAAAFEAGKKCALPALVQEPPTDSYVQSVPDKCDRIIWKGRYYHLPITAPETISQEDVRDAETQLNCAEEILDSYAAHLDLKETSFDCIGDYITAVCEGLKGKP